MHKIGVVSAATGVPIPTLGRWHDRNTFKPSRRDKPSSGSGDHRLFSRATIYQIAIAKTLIDLGIAASPANRAAALFTELFPCGRTLLVITPTGARIVNAEFNATLTDFCGRPFCSAIIVDCRHVVAAVDHALISTKDQH
jgi:MerR HTH family regulatory protein